MKRRNGSGKFNTGEFTDEDINPMDGVGNLADVMLVFACGLMLALITYWNVDVAATESQKESTSVHGEALSETAADIDSRDGEEIDSETLEEYGTVYRDPNTGALYIISEEGT